jgi:hypothetical protein
MTLLEFTIPKTTATAYSRLISFLKANLPLKYKTIDVTFGPDGMTWTWSLEGNTHLIEATISVIGPMPSWKCSLDMENYHMIYAIAKNKAVHGIDTETGIMWLDGQELALHDPVGHVPMAVPSTYDAHVPYDPTKLFETLDIFRKGFDAVGISVNGTMVTLDARIPDPKCNIRVLTDSTTCPDANGQADVVVPMAPLFKMTTARTFSDGLDMYIGQRCPVTLLYTLKGGLGDMRIMVSQNIG